MGLTSSAARLLYYTVARYLPASYLPGGRLGRAVRHAVARRFLADCGGTVNIESGVWLGSGANVHIGSGSGIGRDSYVEGIRLGENVMVGPELLAIVRGHNFHDVSRPICEQGTTEPRLPVVGDGSWIGARVILLPGVIVGRNCVVGAGAVVTKDVPDFTVVAGNPAEVKRVLGSPDSP